jgi:hypothetical protein
LRNDVDELDRWFWDDARVVRFGIGELQYGAAAIAAWRRTSSGVSPDRRHRRVVVTTFGDDLGYVSLEFVDGDAPQVGRQSQVWARIDGAWRIVGAHVSVIAEPSSS